MILEDDIPSHLHVFEDREYFTGRSVTVEFGDPFMIELIELYFRGKLILRRNSELPLNTVTLRIEGGRLSMRNDYFETMEQYKFSMGNEADPFELHTMLTGRDMLFKEVGLVCAILGEFR